MGTKEWIASEININKWEEDSLAVVADSTQNILGAVLSSTKQYNLSRKEIKMARKAE